MADGTRSGSSGLVPSKTTLTGGKVVGVVSPANTHRARLKRMRRTVINSARCHIRQRRGFRDRWLMVTTTYADDQQWAVSDVRDFLQRVRMFFKRRGWPLSYVWVLELTKRGRPHYHVLLRLGVNQRIPNPDDCGWWQKGSTNVEPCRNAVGYVAKYASKGGDREDFPKGARIHGAAGLNTDSRIEVAFWNLPVWVRERITEMQRLIRIAGGFVVPSTGEFLPTPYEVISKGGHMLIILKEQQP